MAKDNFIHDGVTFHVSDGFVWVDPGMLHPRYCLYAEWKRTGSRELDEAKRIAAASTILRRKDQWIREADERGGRPPGVA